ncbi:MAG: hypothetical protein R3C28_13970 [Pirellulaceae bacterium]
MNEFNQLVLEQTRDPSLWVLVSNGILQENMVLPNSRQTLFANKVYEGLSGKTDQPTSGSSPDGFVTMGEFIRSFFPNARQYLTDKSRLG